MSTKFAAIAATAVGLAAFAGQADAREIKIVGSSTVFPYTQAVAEEFARMGGQAPTVEGTGTGGGMKIFCGGVGERHPDITGASRAMTSSEYQDCVENGVTDITEVLLGYDGLTIAISRQGKKMDLTKAQIYQALAAEVPVDGMIVKNPYKKWSDIDKSLPVTNIIAYGPPPTSGTRDAFVDLALRAGCQELPYFKDLKQKLDHAEFRKVLRSTCSAMRQDGPFIEAGENDNLIVQRLIADPAAVGIFGYSFLYENQDRLQAITVGGVEPSMEAIANGQYGISRPLYVYIKNAHRRVIKGMNEFVAEYASDTAMGPGGYLSERGLVVLPNDQLAKTQKAAVSGEKMAAK